MLLVAFIIEIILGKFIIFAYHHIDDSKKSISVYQVYTYDSHGNEDIVRERKIEE